MPTYISLVQFTDKGIQGREGDDAARGRLGCQGAIDGREREANVLDPR